MSHKLVSIILPIYNEQESIPYFLEAMRPIMDAEPYGFELIFVDDGSTDTSLQVLVDAQQAEPRIKIIELTRNFGKELAMAAGFKAASGDAVIPMDVDMQDPPELVTLFLRKWEEGYDVVLGVRANRASDSAFKRMSANLFYSFFSRMCGNRLVPNAGDYRLMNRPAVDALNSLSEGVRFTKGLYAWIGYKQALVEYTRPARIAGTTKWKFWKLWNFALDGITSFSTLPLRIWTYIGGLVAFCGFSYAFFLILRGLFLGVDVPGYTSLMVVTLILGGTILLSVGVVGEYIGRIFEETKNRPLYLVRRRFGFDPDTTANMSTNPANKNN